MARFWLAKPLVRVAIPTFGPDVSPRFCCAQEILVVECEGGRELSRERLVVGGACNPERLQLLQVRGVSLLLCGGFDRRFLGHAQRAGVHVQWGLSGGIEELIGALLAGRFESGSRECWCRGQRGLGGGAQRGASGAFRGGRGRE